MSARERARALLVAMQGFDATTRMPAVVQAWQTALEPVVGRVLLCPRQGAEGQAPVDERIRRSHRSVHLDTQEQWSIETGYEGGTIAISGLDPEPAGLDELLGIVLPELRRHLQRAAIVERTWRKAMDAFGRLSRQVAHDLRNHTSALTTVGELLPERTDDRAFIEQGAGLIRAELKKLQRVVRRLSYGGIAHVTPAKTDIAKLIDELAATLRADLGADVDVTCESAPLQVDARSLMHLLSLIAWHVAGPNGQKPKFNISGSAIKDGFEIIIRGTVRGGDIVHPLESLAPMGLGTYLVEQLCERTKCSVTLENSRVVLRLSS